MNQPVTTDAVKEVIEAHPAGRQSLIPVLQDLQDRLGYLAEEALKDFPVLNSKIRHLTRYAQAFGTVGPDP